MQTTQDVYMEPTQPCSLSLTFPYCEEEEETLQMPGPSEDCATSSPPAATRKYYSPPPITRYSLQSNASQHSGLPYESAQIPESVCSFVTSTSIGLSPKACARPSSAPFSSTVRRPLVLYSNVQDTMQHKIATASFSQQSKKTGKKAKVLKPMQNQKLNPSFVALVKGVCGIFQEQTGKKPNLKKVCESFF